MKKSELRKLIKEYLISELSRISKRDAVSSPTAIKFWALHADIYERLFGKIKDKSKLTTAYQKLNKKVHDNQRQAAVTFFYRIRRDELDGVLAI